MTIRSNLEALESDELLHKVQTSALTETADEIAREILLSRGITPPAANEISQIVDKARRAPHVVFLDYLSICFKGQARLASAFWILGFLIAGFWIVTLMALSFASNPILSTFFELLFITALVAGSTFHLLSIWRCSLNTDMPIWTYAARTYVIFKSSVILAILFSAFF